MLAYLVSAIVCVSVALCVCVCAPPHIQQENAFVCVFFLYMAAQKMCARRILNFSRRGFCAPNTFAPPALMHKPWPDYRILI